MTNRPILKRKPGGYIFDIFNYKYIMRVALSKNFSISSDRDHKAAAEYPLTVPVANPTNKNGEASLSIHRQTVL